MKVDLLTFFKRYYFNLANLFLVLLIVLTLIKCFLDFQIYSQKIDKTNTQELKILVLSTQKTSFGQTDFAVLSDNLFWIANFKGKSSYLEIGKEYKVVAQKTNFDYENKDKFDNENYKLSLGYSGELKILQVQASNQNCNWLCLLVQFQNRTVYNITRQIEQNICQTKIPVTRELVAFGCNNYSALSSSLLIGNTKTFSKNMEQNFRNLGLTHIIAISGFQVIVMISFLEFFLLQFSLSRRRSFFIILVFLVFFVFLVGPQLPILRSSLSVLLSMFVGVILKRRLNSFRALIYSAIILLWINSFYLVNLSFQLAFLASFGLSLIPSFSSLKKYTNWQIIYETITTTLFSFAFTLPIILQINKGIFVTGLLVNILVVPFIPIVYFLSLATSLPLIGEFFGVFTVFLERIFYELVFFASDHNIPLKVQSFSQLSMFTYFALLIIIFSLLNFWLKYKEISK